jgi:hypothetical protein
MCLISYYPPGVQPDMAELRGSGHDEGFGHAIIHDGNLIVSQGMDRDAALATFAVDRLLFDGGPAVFFSRTVTVGPQNLENVQPFTVGGDSATVLFHNGTLPLGDVPAGSSDTRHFAEHVLGGGVFAVDSPGDMDLLEFWMGPHNRMIILTVNPKYQEQVYILNEDQWIKSPHGGLHSNSDFLGQGKGWDEMVLEHASEDGDAGDVWRYRITQPGQCGNCYRFNAGHDETHCPEPRAKVPYMWRNETRRRAVVAAATKEARDGTD